MQQITRKLILTLVALLAVTTGAWADETPLLTINSKDYTSFHSESMTFDDKVTITFSDPVDNDGDDWGWYTLSSPTLLTVAGINGYTITSCKFYVDYGGTAKTGYTIEGESPSVYISEEYVYTDASKSVNIGSKGITKIEVYGTAPAAASGPEVAWDKAKKTGTFTMPGGNVTLEPEYYPQATVADGGVTAADADARATTDDPLVKVDATKLTGAKKLMYFVSNSGTTAPAYDAEGWTDQLPTAEGFTQQGIVYVWYYPVGTDEGVDGATATYSDGDICLQSITARIAAEPTYAVTFADDLTEPDKWTAEPAADVKKGTAVTVTYTGSKKVLGVKAEKKGGAAGKTVDLSTYSGTSYEVTEDVTFTGTTNNEISILYKGDGHQVTLDNVNAPKCFIAAQEDSYNINVKLKGTSRLMGIYTQNAYIIIGEAAAGGTMILVDESTPLGASGATITINGGTVKAKNSSYSALDSILEVNGGAVYLEAGEDNAAVSASASGSVTLYGWNGSAWETYTQDHRYLSTDNSKAPSEWTW